MIILQIRALVSRQGQYRVFMACSAGLRIDETQLVFKTGRKGFRGDGSGLGGGLGGPGGSSGGFSGGSCVGLGSGLCLLGLW